MDLFSVLDQENLGRNERSGDGAMPVPESSPNDSLAAARSLWQHVTNREPLPETLEALKRIPPMVRPSVQAWSEAAMAGEFVSIAASARSGPRGTQCLPVAAIVHAAKTSIFSSVRYASMLAWHVADEALQADIAASILDSNDLDVARLRLWAVPCVNLFVAARHNDAKDSYLAGVKQLVSSQKVRCLVFDAEFIDYCSADSAGFLAACAAVGIPPMYAGTSVRRHAPQHAMLNPSFAPSSCPTLFLNAAGVTLVPNADGQISDEDVGASAPSQLVPVQPVRAATASTEHYPVSLPTAAELQQSSNTSMLERIAAVRHTQARRAAKTGLAERDSITTQNRNRPGA